MKRLKFIKLTAVGTASLSSFFAKSLFDSDLKIQQLLGLNRLHLSNQHGLETRTSKAFQKLKNTAKKDGIDIQIVSGYRSFDDQKRIFERKYKHNQRKGLSPKENLHKIITYSTIPGTSRHHWGTDVDIIDGNAKRPEGDVLLEENYHGNGSYCRLFEWMMENGSTFGFELVYTLNQHRDGFNYEPWHFSYLPVARENFRIQHSQAFKKEWHKLNFYGKNRISGKVLESYFEKQLGDINTRLK